MPEAYGAAVPRPLFKTTIVIWPEDTGDQLELEHLAREATSGDGLCSRYGSKLISWPDRDPDWEPTQFFGQGVDQ